MADFSKERIQPLTVLLDHVKSLGMNSLVQYKNWCEHNSIAVGLRKTIGEMIKEKQFFQELQDSCENRSQKPEILNFKRPVQKIYKRVLSYHQLQGQPILKWIYQALQSTDWSSSTRDYFLFLEEHSKLLKCEKYTKAVIEILRHKTRWVRPINEWSAPLSNIHIQFSSLVQHLLACFQVPSFLEQAFLTGNALHQEWFFYIGAGNNIRKHPDIPVPLTKKMAVHFLSTPGSFEIEEGFVYAQIRSIGGSLRLIQALRGYRPMRDFENNSFWVSIFHFLVNQVEPENFQQVGPIVDYIYRQKFEPTLNMTDRGAIEAVPLEPDFSIKGRTYASIMRLVLAWHHQLNNEQCKNVLSWAFCEIDAFCHFEPAKIRLVKEGGKSKEIVEVPPKLWTIRELTSNLELFEEGRKLRHCVSSYVIDCQKGRSTIWTMEVDIESKKKKVVTIEIAMLKKRVCQVRGRLNRMPKAEEMAVIKRWCLKEGLEIASYL